MSSTAKGFVWAPVGQPVSGTQILDNSIGGSKVISGNPATQGTSKSNSIWDTLGPVALGGLGLAAGFGLWKSGILNDILPTDFQPSGGGNDAGTLDLGKPSSSILIADNPEPQVGDTVTYLADATPQPPPVQDFNNFDGYDIGGGDGGFDFA
jgi:hypothetical protein